MAIFQNQNSQFHNLYNIYQPSDLMNAGISCHNKVIQSLRPW